MVLGPAQLLLLTQVIQPQPLRRTPWLSGVTPWLPPVQTLSLSVEALQLLKRPLLLVSQPSLWGLLMALLMGQEQPGLVPSQLVEVTLGRVVGPVPLHPTLLLSVKEPLPPMSLQLQLEMLRFQVVCWQVSLLEAAV